MKASPIYHALARPPMIMGVTIQCFMVNAMVHLCLFIVTGNFIVFLSLMICHGAAKLCCLIDTAFFDVIFGLLQRKVKQIGNRHWRTHSYSPFE